MVSNDTIPLAGPGFAGSVEGWAVYDSDAPQRAGHPGASRAALAPLLALRDLDSAFKWAFFSTADTETVFFPHAAANLVKDLNPDLPYFLTGHFVRAPGSFRPGRGQLVKRRSSHPIPASVKCKWHVMGGPCMRPEYVATSASDEP